MLLEDISLLWIKCGWKNIYYLSYKLWRPKGHKTFENDLFYLTKKKPANQNTQSSKYSVFIGIFYGYEYETCTQKFLITERLNKLHILQVKCFKDIFFVDGSIILIIWYYFYKYQWYLITHDISVFFLNIFKCQFLLFVDLVLQRNVVVL
jgi:hypothetical protein